MDTVEKEDNMIASQLAELIYNITTDYLERRMAPEKFTALIRGINSAIREADMWTEVDAAYREICWQRNKEPAA